MAGLWPSIIAALLLSPRQVLPLPPLPVPRPVSGHLRLRRRLLPVCVFHMRRVQRLEHAGYYQSEGAHFEPLLDEDEKKIDVGQVLPLVLILSVFLPSAGDASVNLRSRSWGIRRRAQSGSAITSR